MSRTASGDSAMVSLIMPVWQPHVPWLLDAIDSALADPGCPSELIVVDDGCAQPVASMIDANHVGRLRVLRIDHGGQAAALNAGIAAAAGNWFRFIDADDVVIPGSTAHLVEMARGDAVVTYGATRVCDEQLRPTAVIGSTRQGDAVVECLLGRFHTRHPAMLFPRSVVDAAGPWDPAFSVSADWDFVLRALEHAPVRGDGAVAALYRRHGRSVSRTASIGAGEDSRRRMLLRYFERHPEQRGSALERRAWGALYRDRGYAYWNVQEYGASIRRLALAVRAEPLDATLDLVRFAARRVQRLLTPDRKMRASRAA